MNPVLRVFAGGAVAALAMGVIAAEAGPARHPVVVELFTSQGCASCVPADALLAKLAKRPDVIAMSLSVTYWDMLGWKDTLASEANTRRQKAYAQAMGQSAVYTPQIIVDGVSDVVGSREAEVQASIDQHERDAGQTDVPVAVRETKQELQISIGGAPDRNARQAATVWVFQLRNSATVSIGSGENEGRTMTYRNVVSDVRAVAQWKGDPLTIDLPRGSMDNAPHDNVVVLVQSGGYGRIVGAAMLGPPALSTRR